MRSQKTQNHDHDLPAIFKIPALLHPPAYFSIFIIELPTNRQASFVEAACFQIESFNSNSSEREKITIARVNE